GGIAALVIQCHALPRFREHGAAIQVRQLQLSELMIERQELSNRVARVNVGAIEDLQIELERLRSDAAALEKQARELERQAVGNHRTQSGSTATATATA